MHPSTRTGRGSDNARSMDPFANFLDPFAGFGGLGGRPGGILSDVFDSDPLFSDPFFSRGFRAPVGAGSFFGPSFGDGSLLDERPNASPRLGNRRNIPIEGDSRRGSVQIEELPDDHVVDDDARQSNLKQEPIVEHPEDVEDRITSRPRFRNLLEPYGISLPTSYSLQSSSVVFGGDGGQYYSSQTTRRQGADGVVEEEHQEKDTTSGRETHRLSRGLKDKGRSFTRKRNAQGREEKTEILHNLEEAEVPDFERRWETLAETLPNWNRSSSLPAVPSNGGSRANGRQQVKWI